MNEMTISILLLILLYIFIHIFSDIMLDTPIYDLEYNRKKILRHVMFYSINVTIPLIFFEIFKLNFFEIKGHGSIIEPLIFFIVIFISHYFIDNTIGRILRDYVTNKKIRNLFIYLNQISHHIILFVLLYFLYLNH